MELIALTIVAAFVVFAYVGLKAHSSNEPTVTKPPTARQVKKEIGPKAIRGSVVQTRPTLMLDEPNVGKLPMNECGVLEGEFVPDEPKTLALRNYPTYSKLEDGAIDIGPPRSGKSVVLKGKIIDWCGPVVATSTKLDVVADTKDVRRGVSVFNPDHQTHGGQSFPSNFRFNPIVGCEDPATAMRRAGAMCSGTKSLAAGTDKEFWAEKGHVVLSAYFYVAARLGGSLLTVKAWANDKHNQEALIWLRRNADEDNEGLRTELEQVMAHEPKLRDSVFATLSQMLNCVKSAGVREVVEPVEGERLFDIDRFLRRKGTVYLIASDEQYGSISPLFALITSEIYFHALTIARNSKDGRLDPPLLMALDECANICKVPLDKWASEAGGQGIRVNPCVQSIAQLKRTWGEHEAQVILDTLSVKHAFPGIHDLDTLNLLSELAGEKTVPTRTETTNADGTTSITTSFPKVPRFTPEQIKNMRRGESLLTYGNNLTVKVRHRPFWERAKTRGGEGTQALPASPTPRPPTRGGTPQTATAAIEAGNIVPLHRKVEQEADEASG